MKNLIKEILLLATVLVLSLNQISAQNTLQAKEIIQNSLNKISENYPTQTQLLDFFYRETIQENNEYVQLSEATGEIAYSASNTPLHTGKAIQAYQVGDYYNTSFIGSRWHNTLTQPEDQANIKEVRYSNAHFKHDIGQQITGGPLGLTAYDKVKYPSFFFDAVHQKNKTPQTNKNYHFELKGVENLNGHTVYKIDFQPEKIDKNHANFEGTIYVEKNSLALVRLEYVALTQNTQYLAGEEGFLHPRHQVTLEYALNKAKWTLSFIRVQDEVVWQDAKTKTQIASYITTSELWVQGVNTKEVSILAGAHLLPNTLQSSLYDVQKSYGAAMWEDLEKSGKYPSLNEKARKDLEKNANMVLDTQFSLQPEFQSKSQKAAR